MHVRAQIREAIKSALAGDGTIQVESNRGSPLSELTQSRYVVYTLRESTDESQSTVSGFVRILTATVEFSTVCTQATLDTILDERAVFIENRLNYSRLGGLALKTVLRATDISVQDNPDSLIGTLMLTFDVTYRSNPLNSEELS